MKNILFLSHTINKHCAVKLEGCHSAAKMRGWTIREAEFGWTAWNLADIVSTLKPDGIIFEGGRLTGKVDLRPLSRIPTVYLDTDFPAPRGKVAVCSDAEAIADLAADELLASKPVETAFFSLTPHKAWSEKRATRFRSRMREAKIPFRILTLAEDVCRLRKPFAVFAVNDISAATLLCYATNSGLVCPRDFTLVSVDNETLFCENTKPTVSSVEQDIVRAGIAAVEAMDGLFKNHAGRQRAILIPPRRLVRRASSVRPLACATTAQRIAAFIDAHALEAIDIADIAAAFGCSRRTIESHYRAAHGQSIGAAILDRRFVEVEQLLRNPRQMLAPIANLCGWKSPAHLMRSFKSRYGITMSDWRKRHQT